MRRLWTLVFVLCLASPALHSQDAGGVKPESIDPYRADAGDFLDVDIAALNAMAQAAYQAGKYEDAARYFLVALRGDIRNSGSLYDLACCYGLLGKAELAAKYLDRAVKAGYEDVDHVNGDKDFDKVRKDPAFVSVVNGMAERARARAAGTGEVCYFDAPGYVKCRVHLPAKYDPKKRYTLLVGLHGFGDTAEHFSALWTRMGEPDLIYATPETQYPFLIGNQTGYSWEVTDGAAAPSVRNRSREMTEEYVVRAVQGLKLKYNPKDVYLLGFSQGCGLTYTTGIKNPKVFAGIVCFGGWLDTEWLRPSTIDKAKGMRVFIAHGKKDNVVAYDNGTKARDVLTKNGNDVTFFPFDGAHQVPEGALKAAIAWIGK